MGLLTGDSKWLGGAGGGIEGMVGGGVEGVRLGLGNRHGEGNEV